MNAGQVSRLLERLRLHGLIKRVGRTYKYDLTALGKRALLAGLEILQTLMPQLLTAKSQQLIRVDARSVKLPVRGP